MNFVGRDISFRPRKFFIMNNIQETMLESQSRNIPRRITTQHCVLRIAYRATINHTTLLLHYVT